MGNKVIKIKGNYLLMGHNNKVIRVLPPEEVYELEYKNSLEYKVTKMNFKELLGTYTKYVTKATIYEGYEYKAGICYMELLRYGIL